MSLVLLDTTEHSDLVVLMLHGVMIYADDQNDPEAQNNTFDALFVATALSKCLDTKIERIMVPPGEYHEADEVVDWYNRLQAKKQLAANKQAAKPKVDGEVHTNPRTGVNGRKRRS